MRGMYFALIVVFGLLAPVVVAQPPTVKVELVQESTQVPAGGTLRAALRVKLPPGYHVNSNKPLDDFLIPTRIAATTPDGVRVQEVVFPDAITIQQSGSDLAVFEEEFTLGVALTADETAALGNHEVELTFHYQACDEKACYAPAKKPMPLSLEIVPQGTEVVLEQEALFDSIPFTGAQTVPIVEVMPPDVKPVAAGEDEEILFELLDEFEILGTEGGYLGTDAFIEFIDDAEAGRVRQGWFEGKGPIAIIGLILLGGLALNLTPCVLPMIPINLAIIGAGAQAGSRARGFALGGAYGLAMALVYGVLGLVVILTAGTFGTINSSAWFNLGIAALFVVLGLAMFDVINIDFSRFQSKLNLGGKSKGTFLLAFGMGAVAALLAGACVAPVVIQVIVYSADQYAKGAAIALALPFILGVGMALPWPIAGAGLSFLPKPGKWMIRVKQAFGVFILGFAAYYAYVGYGILSQRWVDEAEVARSAEAMIEEGWVPSLTQGLMQGKEENKLVLVDMWATWCKNCLRMDDTTLKEHSVTERLEDYVKIKFQAEDPNSSPATEVMRHFDAKGLPTYAILRHKS